jgi:hypothetical protein
VEIWEPGRKVVQTATYYPGEGYYSEGPCQGNPAPEGRYVAYAQWPAVNPVAVSNRVPFELRHPRPQETTVPTSTTTTLPSETAPEPTSAT